MRKKIVWLPYDFDTAIGINNEGALVFPYNLEDTDHLEGGANVFNGQDSVFWNNLRKAFPAELKQMFQELRRTGALSYDKVERMFEEHQSKWPEAIFNEDAQFKYLDPLFDDNDGSMLSMLQGSKAEQRKWWLYNRFRYLDSKYNAGDALTDVITVRGYAKDNITVTPYADVYPAVKYGSYLVTERGSRNTPTTLICPLDKVNDTEIYIYSASQLASVGDLSGLKVGYADFSKAVKLKDLTIGSTTAGYDNPNLTELHLGNNRLLRTLNVRNCSALAAPIDASGCVGLQEADFRGTAITALTLPDGGEVKRLYLPATITNLTILNQPGIEAFEVPSFDNVTTLRIENCSSVINPLAILSDMAAGGRVRLIGFTMPVTSTDDVEDFYDLLDTMRGLDESGGNVNKAQVSGTITGLDSVNSTWLSQMHARYPDITIEYNHITAILKYYNYDGSQLLYTETITDGGDGTYTNEPTREPTDQYEYAFVGWNTAPNRVYADANCTKNVTSNRDVYAAYSVSERTYTVYFYNGSTLLETVTGVLGGGTAVYPGETPTFGPDPDNYEFTGWNPSNTNIKADTSCYAQFRAPSLSETITDTWAEIAAAVKDGTYATKYSVGDTKILNLDGYGQVAMQIVGFNVDTDWNGTTLPITWISQQVLPRGLWHRFNPVLQTDPTDSSKYVNGTGAIGGWTSCELRAYLRTDILPLIDEDARNAIVQAKKYSYMYKTDGSSDTYITQDKLWIPSYREMFNYSGKESWPATTYTSFFTSNESRVKTVVGGTSGNVYGLRSANGKAQICTVYTSGSASETNASWSPGLVIGFCM